MGNSFTHEIFIVGEVDYRVICLDRPLLYKTNLCFRYPTFYSSKPLTLEVNYDQPLAFKYLNVSNRETINAYSPLELRHNDKTTIAMIQGYQSSLTGFVYNCQIIDSKIVPITKGYAMK